MKSVDLFLRNLRNLRFLLAKAEQLQRKHRRLPSKGRGVLECEGGRPGTFHVKHRNTAPPSVSRETPRRSARRKRSADDADRKPQKTQKAGSQSAGYGKRRRAKRLDGWLPGYSGAAPGAAAPTNPRLRHHPRSSAGYPPKAKQLQGSRERRGKAPHFCNPLRRALLPHRTRSQKPRTPPAFPKSAGLFGDVS